MNFNDEDELEDEDEEYDEETTTTNNNNTTNSPQVSSKTTTTTTKPTITTPKIETTDDSYNLENDVDLIDIGADEEDPDITTKQTRKPIIFENEEQEEDTGTRALEPLYLDNLTSTSSANISSSGSSGTNQTSSSSTSSSAKIMSSSTSKKDQDLVISPLTPNKFICIQFPLNSESTIVEEKSTPSNSVKVKTKAMSPQPTNAPQPHGIVLNRFHSFRLDDKLLNHTFNKPSQLLISDEASKTNIANNKSDNITTRSNLDLSNDSQIK